jgi:hypothetical protein
MTFCEVSGLIKMRMLTSNKKGRFAMLTKIATTIGYILLLGFAINIVALTLLAWTFGF